MEQTRRAWMAAARGLGVALLMAAGGTGWAAASSSQFTISGAVQHPLSYDLASLSALPAQSQSVSFSSGAGPQSHVYTGTSLWGLLDGAGLVTRPGVKNDVLNRYVLATGSDGYKTVFSLGELNPGFGNRPDLVAYAETVNGQSQSLGADGFARVTAPGDVKGGRYVSNLVNLDVRSSGAKAAGQGGGVSSAFSVSGAVTASRSFDLQALQALPSITRVVNGVSYTGVSFWDLLNSTVGIALDPTVKNDVLGKYVVATGSDGYQVVFSLGELNPGFGNQPDLIAYAANGQSLGSNGFARLIVPNDVKAGRWVSNLVSLEVLSASPVPEPRSWALLAGGLGLLGAVVARRRDPAGP